MTHQRGTGRSARAALGMFGEELARTRLEAEGYRTVERNWHCRRGEIDLIVERGGSLIFVEVRTRRGRSPELSIGRLKRQRLRAAAQLWLAEHCRNEPDWRIDVILIEVDRSGRLVRYEQMPSAVEAAFTGSYAG
jgi:putative endonuclease